MSAAVGKRHHADGNGVLRHLQGWHPSRPKHPSQRRLMTITMQQAAALPASCFDKQFSLVPTYDQGQLGSCTANAACYSYRHVIVKHLLDGGMLPADVAKNLFAPSRLYLYDKSRQAQGTPLDEDSGSTTDVTNQALETYGVCDESLVPYSDDEAQWSQDPSDAAETDAQKHKEVLGYEPATIQAQKHSIVQGFGVQFGFTCYQGLMSANAAATGEIPMPEPGEQPIGGHELYKVGFDDNYVIGIYKGVWIVANSWGDWGATFDGVKRYGLLPYEYDHSGLAGDNRTIRLVSP